MASNQIFTDLKLIRMLLDQAVGGGGGVASVFNMDAAHIDGQYNVDSTNNLNAAQVAAGAIVAGVLPFPNPLGTGGVPAIRAKIGGVGAAAVAVPAVAGGAVAAPFNAAGTFAHAAYAIKNADITITKNEQDDLIATYQSHIQKLASILATAASIAAKSASKTFYELHNRAVPVETGTAMFGGAKILKLLKIKMPRIKTTKKASPKKKAAPKKKTAPKKAAPKKAAPKKKTVAPKKK